MRKTLGILLLLCLSCIFCACNSDDGKVQDQDNGAVTETTDDNGVKDTGDMVEDVTDDVGDAANDVVDDTGKAVEDITNDASKTVEDLGDDVTGNGK